MPVGPASGGGGSTGDVKAGGAFVEISARDRLSAQLAGLLAKTRAFAASLTQIGKVTAFAGLRALTPLAGLFVAGANRAAQIEGMAEQLGFSVEQMQRLKFAADAAGVSVEDVLRKPEKYAGLMGQATALNADMIRQAATASRELAGAWINLQAALVPVVQTVGPLVSRLAKFAQNNPELVRGITLGAAAMTGLGVATFAAGKGLSLIVGSVTGLAKGLSLVVTVLTKSTGLFVGVFGILKTGLATGIALFTVLFSKATLVFGLVAGFGGLFALSLTGWKRLAGDVGTAFSRVGQTFGVMLGGITDAVKAGDFDKAFKIFAKGIESIWYEMLLNMAKAFSGFIENNRDRLIALGSLVGGLKGAGFGGRFGPWGALIGGGIGAVGGGVGVDQLAKLIEGIAGNTGLEDRRAKAQAELDRLRKDAAKAAARVDAPGDTESLARRISASRGAFRLLGDASQQFGRNDSIDSKQLAQLVEIKKTLDKQTQLQIDALNGGRFK